MAPRRRRARRAPHAGRRRDLTLAYDHVEVARDLSVDIPAGRITCIVGANACGKSTLLRALARLLKPRAGVVLLDGESIHRMPTKDGRHPARASCPRHRSRPRASRSPTWSPAAATPTRSGSGSGRRRRGRRPRRHGVHRTLDLADRSVDELSGGQRQRVWIAMALAQGTDLMLLDEPTTYLDLAHQVEVLDLLDDLNRGEQRTIVLVLHDLNQAARYSHHLIAMRDGRLVAEGPPAEIITEALVTDVFGLRCRVVADPVAGTPLVVPIGRRSRWRTERTEGGVRTGPLAPACRRRYPRHPPVPRRPAYQRCQRPSRDPQRPKSVHRHRGGPTFCDLHRFSGDGIEGALTAQGHVGSGGPGDRTAPLRGGSLSGDGSAFQTADDVAPWRSASRGVDDWALSSPTVPSPTFRHRRKAEGPGSGTRFPRQSPTERRRASTRSDCHTGGVPSALMETQPDRYVCSWCACAFRRRFLAGRKPVYCRRTCRQRAYEARRRGALVPQHPRPTPLPPRRDPPAYEAGRRGLLTHALRPDGYPGRYNARQTLCGACGPSSSVRRSATGPATAATA